MKIFKNKLALIFSVVVAVVIIIAGTFSTEKYIVYDSSVATNDSVVSGWVYIGNNPNVAISYAIDDTINAHFTVRHRYGQNAHMVLANDTVTTSGTALTGKSMGKVLRGYGLATDLIPGSNFIYVKGLAVTGQTGSGVRVALMTAP